jgi:AraC-like DNA-binding protein
MIISFSLDKTTEKNKRKGEKIRHMFETVKHVNCGRFIARDQWIHPTRTERTFEIIFMIDGEAHMREDNVEYHLKKDDVLVLLPHHLHTGIAYSYPASFYWLHYLDGPPLPFSSTHIKSPYHLSLLFKQLLHHTAQTPTGEAADYFTRLILLNIYDANTQSTNNALINRVTTWIQANDDRQLQANEVAEYFGYNVDHLSRLFRANLGKSLKQYLIDVKLDQIKNHLLNPRFTLTQIAMNTGFDDYKIFLKFFKYHEKMTPTKFRQIYTQTTINTK